MSATQTPKRKSRFLRRVAQLAFGLVILLLVAIGVGIWFYLRWRRRLRRAELASVAARASRDTEQRLLGGRAAANGHAVNGHAVNGDGPKPPAAPTEAEAAPVEAKAAPAEAAAPGEAADGGGTVTEGTAE